jgi:D-lactate dehydrogenase (cytochrome)
MLVDPDNPEEIACAEGINHRMVELAIAMDGTCTGEHGVGQGKMKYLLAEHGEPALAAMRAIKRTLDPLDILNPGKIVNL